MGLFGGLDEMMKLQHLACNGCSKSGLIILFCRNKYTKFGPIKTVGGVGVCVRRTTDG